MTGPPTGEVRSPSAGATPQADDSDADSRFWEFVAHGELRLPRCRACGTWIFPPSFCCPECLSLHLGWDEIERRGTIWSFTVYHHSFAEHLDARIPYNVALVEIKEGPLLLGNVELSDERIEQELQLRVGLPVNIELGHRDDQPFYWFTIDHLLPQSSPH